LILSLLLAALILWLLSQWLFPSSGQYGGIFDGFGRIELPTLPSVSLPTGGFSPPTSSGSGSSSGPVVVKETPSEGSGFFDGLLLIPLALFLGWKGIQKAREGRKQVLESRAGDTEEARWANLQGLIREVVNEIRQVIAQKERVWKIIDELSRRKMALGDELLDVYHKMINDPRFDPANLAAEDTTTHQILEQ
jgi:hypothetical protein